MAPRTHARSQTAFVERSSSRTPWFAITARGSPTDSPQPSGASAVTNTRQFARLFAVSAPPLTLRHATVHPARGLQSQREMIRNDVFGNVEQRQRTTLAQLERADSALELQAEISHCAGVAAKSPIQCDTQGASSISNALLGNQTRGTDGSPQDPQPQPVQWSVGLRRNLDARVTVTHEPSFRPIFSTEREFTPVANAVLGYRRSAQPGSPSPDRTSRHGGDRSRRRPAMAASRPGCRSRSDVQPRPARMGIAAQS